MYLKCDIHLQLFEQVVFILFILVQSFPRKREKSDNFQYLENHNI